MIKRFSPPLRAVEPSRNDVFRLLGLGDSASPSQASIELFDSALEIFKRQVRPVGLIKAVSSRDFARIYTGEGKNEPDTPLGRIFPQSEHLALMILTLGEKISRSIGDMFDSRDFALASMLDAIASQAADQAVRFSEQIFHLTLVAGDQIDSVRVVLLYSPGYCGWHISSQKGIFEYMQPSEIGVELNPQFLMTPLKSVSGVLVGGLPNIHNFKNDFSFCRHCADKSCIPRRKALIQNNKETNHGNIESNFRKPSARQ
jgi:hypothetical protein